MYFLLFIFSSLIIIIYFFKLLKGRLGSIFDINQYAASLSEIVDVCEEEKKYEPTPKPTPPLLPSSKKPSNKKPLKTSKSSTPKSSSTPKPSSKLKSLSKTRFSSASSVEQQSLLSLPPVPEIPPLVLKELNSAMKVEEEGRKKDVNADVEMDFCLSDDNVYSSDNDDY
jgi:hypothetical protein